MSSSVTPGAPQRSRPSPAAISRAKKALSARFSEEALVYEADLLERYAEDASQAGSYLPDMVVRPSSSAEVATVLRIANELLIPVTPRGLGSGKAGGALPIYGGIVLSLERMNRLKEIHRDDMFCVAEPGVITGDLMRCVEEEGLFYPPDPNSFDICSIGGNVACNAGGPRALKYGVTRRYVLELEVVLPTGDVIRVGKRTLKHATGYDLAGMIVGSEGTLGVITEVTCRLIPKPRAVATALVTFGDVRTASRALTRVLAQGVLPRTLELLDHHALAALRRKSPGRFPDNAGALIILETDAMSEERAFEDLERAANLCTEQGALEVLVAQDEAQRQRIWEPRRYLSVTLSETAPKKISEDVVVPRSQIPTLLDAVSRISEERGIRVATYGHAGDGNLHVNVLFDQASERAAKATVQAIMETTVSLGGTISGEHGIGLLKRDFMPLEQSATLLDLQRSLKRTLDPRGVLNPGKILPSGGVTE